MWSEFYFVTIWVSVPLYSNSSSSTVLSTGIVVCCTVYLRSSVPSIILSIVLSCTYCCTDVAYCTALCTSNEALDGATVDGEYDVLRVFAQAAVLRHWHKVSKGIAEEGDSEGYLPYPARLIADDVYAVSGAM